MAHAYALAAELAQPVARGHMPLTHAYAALLAFTVRAERRGELGAYKAPDVFCLQKHILGLHLERLETRRAITESRIKNRIWPLMKQRQPRNLLLAEAHDVNGAAGFPFDEPDVTTITAREMHFAGRQRHG